MSLKNISEFLALRRNTSLLLVALLLAGTGEKLWLGFAPKYIETLGGSILIIGLFDALQTFLGAIYAYPGGWLTDHWGQRKSLLLFSVISIAGYILVLVWQSWLALLLGSFLFLAWSALSLPATLSVIATSLQSHRHTMGVGVQSMIRRVPMMIGPLIGGWLLTCFGWTDGVRYALALCIGMSLLTLAFQWFMFEPQNSGTGFQPVSSSTQSETHRQDACATTFLGVVKTFTPALRELLVSDILIRFCERIPYAFIILWAMDFGHLNAQRYSYLVTFEMVAAMLCYIPVAHLADKYGRRPFVLITFVFFTLFPVTLLWAHDFRWLALAFVVRGLKEFGEPARKALIIGEAAPELRARTYGAYYLIRDCTVTSGSFLGAGLWYVSPQANFLGAIICGAMGTVWFWWFIYRKKK
ncbi:MAG TPA: MFS transporter [Verrucomicrobiae bacterium]|jgi:MFS family permease